MKKLTRIGALLLALTLALLVPFSVVNAEGIYNTYNGVEYETEDEIKELQDTLENDGYIKISNDLFDELRENGYNWSTYMTDENVLYVEAKAWEKYLETKEVEEINKATIITSNYVNDIVDEGTISDNVDDNIDENADWGTIIIKGAMDADILNNKKHPTASVILYNTTTKEKYNVELDFYNNYTASIKAPIGTYKIYSAFIDELYPPTIAKELEMDGKGQELTTLGTLTIDVEFGESCTKEEYAQHQYHKEKKQEKAKESIGIIVPIIVLIIFALILIGGGIYAYRWYKKKNNDE